MNPARLREAIPASWRAKVPARLRDKIPASWRAPQDPAVAWLTAALRQPPTGLDHWEVRRRLISQLAPGRSFLDLGGMYLIAGEVAFLAEQAGATRVVLCDATDPSDEFDEKHRRNGSHVQYIQGDLHDPDDIAALGPFDVVWCTGVIYHSPNPLLQLMHLRRMAREHLVLGTHVIPEVPGLEQLCMLYPGVSPEMQDTFASIHGGAERFPGMATSFDDSPFMAYANMWWGFSPSAVRSMMHFSGFEITDEYLYSPFWLDVLARPGGASPDIYPGPGFARERGRQRFAQTPPDQLPPWATRQTDLRQR